MPHTIAAPFSRRVLIKLAVAGALVIGAFVTLGAGTSQAACVNQTFSTANVNSKLACVEDIQGMLHSIHLAMYDPGALDETSNNQETAEINRRLLTYIALLDPTIDGYFGKNTQSAVTALQGDWNHTPYAENTGDYSTDMVGVVGQNIATHQRYHTWFEICKATMWATDSRPGTWYKSAGCASIVNLGNG